MLGCVGSRVALAVLFFLFAGLAGAGDALRPKRPSLGLRAFPRVAFSPVEVVAVAELKGGQDVEEFYCPGLEWDWGDGSRSAHEADCAPFEAGMKLARFFSARHAFRAPGAYRVQLRLRRADRTVAVATVPVTVRGHSARPSGF
jgi:hypothetical protein